MLTQLRPGKDSTMVLKPDNRKAWRRVSKAGVLAATLFIAVAHVKAATYYISPTGNDTSGTGTSASPWRTATKAFSMGGGHTYIWKDGLYNYTGANIVNPPSGTAAVQTIL